MQVIIDFFASFVQYIGFLVDFVIGTVTDLVYMVGLLGDVVIHLPGYMGWLPSPIVTFLMLVISVVVIYKIIGREG